MHLIDELRPAPVGADPARVSVVQTVDVAEQDQRIGTDRMSHQRGEPIVVTEPDLVGGHGVVLVDHRHHPQRHETFQRALGIGVVAPVREVIGGQQHLSHRSPVPGERRPQACASAS